MIDWFKFLRFQHRLRTKMEEVHQLPDPWSANVQKELIHSVIESYCSSVDTILEIGSGDGLISEKLVQKCNRLFCVEISKRAILKAKENLKNHRSNIQFVHRDIYTVSLKTYDTVVMSFILDYLGQNQFAKKFVWLMMDLCTASREILIIQPIFEQVDIKKIETVAAILHHNSFILSKSEIKTDSRPHLYVGLFRKKA